MPVTTGADLHGQVIVKQGLAGWRDDGEQSAAEAEGWRCGEGEELGNG